MSKKVRFVFSTRTLGSDKAFARPSRLKDNSRVLAYLRDHFSESESDVWGWFRFCYESGNQEFANSFKIAERMAGDEKIFLSLYRNPDMQKKILDALFMSQIVSPKIAREISYCPGDSDSERFEARFSYYRLNNDLDSDFEAFAVPHLEWAADMDWIKTLIDEPFGTSNDCKILYLVLHDNDVPGYEKKPFRFLTAEEIFGLFYPSKAVNIQKQEIKKNELEKDLEKCIEDEKKKELQNQLNTIQKKLNELKKERANHIDSRDGELFFKNDNGKLIRIIVFQHTWNDVMIVLKKTGITPKDIFNRLGPNEKFVNEIFNPKSKDLSGLFRKLIVDASADLCQNDVEGQAITEKDFPQQNESDSEKKKYYVYEDNGALLTELMHVRTDIHSAEQFVKLIDILREPAFANRVKDIRKMKFPIIIRIYKKFFHDWEELVAYDNKDKVRTHPNKKALEENLNRTFSFYNNSSIWVRIVDNKDEEAFNQAVAEFEYFNNIGLYDYDSAWENLEYDTRVIKQNYLESALNGHGNYITPELFGDEVKAMKILLGNSVPKTT